MPDLSPLSNAERSISIDLTNADERAKSLEPGRSRAVLVQPIAPDRRQAKDSRHAVVGMYDYENNRSVVAVVDLKAQAVVSMDQTDVQYQLDDEEQEEANELAAADSRVKEFLRDRPMNPLTRLYFPPEGSKADQTHRHAIVFLRPSNQERRYAVVDLSQRAVNQVFGLDQVASE